MPKVWFGSKSEEPVNLEQSDEFVVIRRKTSASRGLPHATDPTAAVVDPEPVLDFPEANVSVYKVKAGLENGVDSAKSYAKNLPDVRFAGRVLTEQQSGQPIVYTENLFIKFKDELNEDECRKLILSNGLGVKRQLDYAENAYFVEAHEGTGQGVFEIAESLLKHADVEYAHPEIVRRRVSKKIYRSQWHLQETTINGVEIDAHANVSEAHKLAKGQGTVIAIIDDGVDVDHPEFGTRRKIVAPRDATRRNADPRPKYYDEDHGTACAGVACGAGRHGASGVAPAARLMPIRLASNLGSLDEAEAIYWAAKKGADVISCSWGPPDGNWTRPDERRHYWPIPASTRLAIDYAAEHGRDGKGCIILFAAGNGNEDVKYDGYASHEKVLAIAASNDRSKRSIYSDFGNAIFCCFPSNDFAFPPANHPNPLTRGIWTTDRRGYSGYNPGDTARGDQLGDYTATFGGTSSACPGVAGTIALMLEKNPDLDRKKIRTFLAKSCQRIDPRNGNYDASGHSHYYGFGRVNALKAVELAISELD